MSKSICTDCSHKLRCDMADSRGGDTAITRCYGFANGKSTKADRIRAKSDEELAEFFGTLPCCPPGEDLEDLCFPLDSCEGTEMKVKCWLKWLRQEAT